MKKETEKQKKKRLEKENCKHEKTYYCYVTGGGRCRKCKKLTGC